MQTLVEGVNSNDPVVQLEAMRGFRRLLSDVSLPLIQEVVAAGILPRIVQFLQLFQHPELQLESAWVLSSIASGDGEEARVIIDCGVLPILLRLLTLGSPSTNNELREAVVSTLGNISAISTSCRDFVLQFGVMNALVQVLQPSTPADPAMVRGVARTLSSLCRGMPAPDFQLVAPALPALSRLIHSDDEGVVIDACWAFSFLTRGSNDNIQAVIDANVCHRMVELLQHPNLSVQTHALRTIGNIITGEELQTQTMLNIPGLLPALLALLSSHQQSIRREACWTISNITAGTMSQIMAVIEAGLVPPLIQLLATDAIDVKKEALWAIGNIPVGGSDEQVRYVVDQGFLKPLLDVLQYNERRISATALDVVENILRVGAKEAETTGIHPYVRMIEEYQGVSKIKLVPEETRDQAVLILDTYFNGLDIGE